MNASIVYRVAAVCLLLFAVAHTIGFSQPPDPKWGVNAVYDSMRSTHFNVLGSDRTYWDFFLASGFTVAVLYVLSAILAWQLGGLPAESLSQMRLLVWTFALGFAGIAIVSIRYLFIIPMVFSIVITLCLAAGAWLSSKG